MLPPSPTSSFISDCFHQGHVADNLKVKQLIFLNATTPIQDGDHPKMFAKMLTKKSKSIIEE